MKVKAWSAPVVLPTYEPAAPDKNPMFLEKRVYQGSSGRVYPLPCYDRIADQPTPRSWQAIHLENEYLYVMILPELGGRIHIGRDRTNGYDFFYNQPVIKPALVGLAGPWCSGGVEFNWPQHHRPATFMPVDTRIEAHADGSVTVWCSDHDPMARMKGMHGVCLYPGRSDIELKVRAYNRTPQAQTFLWWANVATRVHAQYQSFFPPDVTHVADHARRAMSEYPLCRGRYYGVDYGRRVSGVGSQVSGFGPETHLPNDLSWYANIPVPTSYMCMGSQADFFGGYDHAARAGVVHVANHHIAPGKKQWTWGHHPFGHAWDRNLTDPDARGEYAPYIEIMAGVYTDNQPDFSFLMPGETKTWSQHWYPIREIGPAQQANREAAVSLAVKGRKARLGVATTSRLKGAQVLLTYYSRGSASRVRHASQRRGDTLCKMRRNLGPGSPLVQDIQLPPGVRESDLRLTVSCGGREIISYQPQPRARGRVPPPATEPPPPGEMASADELYVTGLHLEQYRHATRCPTLYWREALRRDPLDARCNNALGRWHLQRGEFASAETHFRAAIARLTRRNANPYDGEPCYNLGLCLRHLGRDDEAYGALYKSVWNQAWQAAGYHALAEIDCGRGHWAAALDHLDRSLRMNADNLRARDLKAIALRRLGRAAEAESLLGETLALDPLDRWAGWLRDGQAPCDTQTRLDLALDFARAGLAAEAIELLKRGPRDAGTEPLVDYYLGWLHGRRGATAAALAHYRKAAVRSPDYCFPARLEEQAILAAALRANPGDARAPHYLGNWLYDRRRHAEAIRMWERAARLNPAYAVTWRNLGIGYYNVAGKPGRARAAYDRAIRADADDARLWYERDQLWKRLGVRPAARLAALENRLDLVNRRDDLSVELCTLYSQVGRPEAALQVLAARKFQPWEGGEGQALGQHKRAKLAVGRAALARGDAAGAAAHVRAALDAPANLGEAWHLLQNQSDVHYWLGVTLDRRGDAAGARQQWRQAAEFRGDFQAMSVRAFSEMTYYSALSMLRLGRTAQAARVFRDLLAYARQLEKAPATVDYFATSLPTMLLFDDDLQARQATTALFLQAQAYFGLSRCSGRSKSGLYTRKARGLLRRVLRRDPNHALAADLLAELAP